MVKMAVMAVPVSVNHLLALKTQTRIILILTSNPWQKKLQDIFPKKSYYSFKAFGR